jgi:hypothetical protein
MEIEVYARTMNVRTTANSKRGSLFVEDQQKENGGVVLMSGLHLPARSLNLEILLWSLLPSQKLPDRSEFNL